MNLLFLLFLSFFINADMGSKFTANIGGSQTEVIITKDNKLNVEMAFTQIGLLGSKPLWQRFKLEKSAGSLKVAAGFIFSSDMKAPEKLDNEYLSGYDGISMNQFLFSNVDDFKGQYLGEEEIIVPAGKTKAKHFRHSENGQVIDYWISDEAKPIGLVQMTSKGTKMTQNYQLKLKSLVKNVKPKIDPAKAVRLSDKTKKWLPKPGKQLSLY